MRTYTGRQTGRWTVQKYGYRLQDGKIYRKTNIHTYFAYLQYCTYNGHTDRQTDRIYGKE